MRVSNLFKEKVVQKAVDSGLTRIDSQTAHFKTADSVVNTLEDSNKGIPALLNDVQELATRTRKEVESTIESVKSKARSLDFDQYLQLVETNYVPIETLLEEGATYPKYTAPVAEINKLEDSVKHSDVFSEPFLHTLYLHLNRSEVLDHVLNKMYDPILKSVYGQGVIRDKNNKVVKQSNQSGVYAGVEDYRSQDASNVDNNLALKYLLYKSREELQNILEFSLRLKKDYDNPIEEELNDFFKFFTNTHFNINKQSIDLLLQKHVRDYESLWRTPKVVFTQRYSNPLNEFLIETLNIQLVKITGSINEEVDDIILGVEEYINYTGSGTLGIVNTLLKNSVVEMAKHLRSSMGAKESNIIKETQAREGAINARFLEQIVKSVKSINFR